mmetsp:Transcript_22809/g.76589  ORF Transcript_22809/g.76589 Transcript_22809/m.76589 type:complete len:159 (+) Transcript_22809:515-991(+)
MEELGCCNPGQGQRSSCAVDNLLRAAAAVADECCRLEDENRHLRKRHRELSCIESKYEALRMRLMSLIARRRGEGCSTPCGEKGKAPCLEDFVAHAPAEPELTERFVELSTPEDGCEEQAPACKRPHVVPGNADACGAPCGATVGESVTRSKCSSDDA